MIYVFKFIPTSKKDDFTTAEFTLSADTKVQLYSRIQHQYGVPKDKVEILKEIDESIINVNIKGEKKNEKDIKRNNNESINRKDSNKKAKNKRQ